MKHFSKVNSDFQNCRLNFFLMNTLYIIVSKVCKIVHAYASTFQQNLMLDIKK